jgi:hypothetical protein
VDAVGRLAEPLAERVELALREPRQHVRKRLANQLTRHQAGHPGRRAGRVRAADLRHGEVHLGAQHIERGLGRLGRRWRIEGQQRRALLARQCERVAPAVVRAGLAQPLAGERARQDGGELFGR